jgi:hypothetical protein
MQAFIYQDSKLCIYTYGKHMSDSLHPRDLGVIVRNTQSEDIPKIVDLQKESFPYLARYGNIWHPEELESHLRIFPQGQFVAVEPNGMVVGSASTLMIVLILSMQNIHGKRSLQTVGSQIISLMEIVCMVQIYLHIQNTDMKV